jgi:ribosome-associated protein
MDRRTSKLPARLASSSASPSVVRDNGLVSEPGQDLRVPPGPGLRGGLLIPAGELLERFSRSAGPGGQGVNTTDSRVELVFDVATSSVLSDTQRGRMVDALGRRLTEGRLTVVASEHRSQLRNRAAARDRLVALLQESLAPPPPARRATRPTRGSQRRRLESKKRRGQVKSARGRVPRDQG